MKRQLLLISILIYSVSSSLYAQRVIWQDDFETSKGWSEFEDVTGKAVVKNGTLVIKRNDGLSYFSRCKTNLDGNKNFTISAEIYLRHGLSQLVNGKTVGMIFDYYDRKNYKAFYIEKGFVWFIQRKDGILIREEKDFLKNYIPDKKNRDKNAPDISIEIQKKGQNVLFLVNGEETLEMDGIVVSSNRIGFIVSGGQEVTFDNVKIMQ